MLSIRNLLQNRGKIEQAHKQEKHDIKNHCRIIYHLSIASRTFLLYI